MLNQAIHTLEDCQILRLIKVYSRKHTTYFIVSLVTLCYSFIATVCFFLSSSLLEGSMVFPKLPSRERETKKNTRDRVRERESFCWWKWQWHWAYCLVKHTHPPPHAAWPSNRGQWNLLIGSRGLDRWRGNWAETVSFCHCHTQKMGWLQSPLR